MITCDFTLAEGGPENNSATGKLEVGGTVSINGNTDLSSAIHFNDQGRVYGITLNGSGGSPFNYAVQVDAEGPSGAFSGSGHLFFADETGDVYTLAITKHARDTHTVRYNSKQPRIVSIRWNNKG